MDKVLDSYSVIAFLENQPGADMIGHYLKEARDRDKPLRLCVVNWGEIYYINCRAVGRGAAEQVMLNLDTLPIEVVPVDRNITIVAADFKARMKMSYADCFAAALAKIEKAALVTGDKKFKQVEGELKLLWL